ncbi:hypothetical protein P167DRAFT_547940 [Morchella conica CCBAS932]|uniref:Uncharacterized protein n=1 Tax=Morchella conica CCBAS932 TaxID=1392247 RepID=A0A3N4KUP7_9PEZI|nr:hypothetical protein P167DRAFT_547940 [Morchella conica CCBAS932]
MTMVTIDRKREEKRREEGREGGRGGGLGAGWMDEMCVRDRGLSLRPFPYLSSRLSNVPGSAAILRGRVHFDMTSFSTLFHMFPPSTTTDHSDRSTTTELAPPPPSHLRSQRRDTPPPPARETTPQTKPNQDPISPTQTGETSSALPLSPTLMRLGTDSATRNLYHTVQHKVQPSLHLLYESAAS